MVPPYFDTSASSALSTNGIGINACRRLSHQSRNQPLQIIKIRKGNRSFIRSVTVIIAVEGMASYTDQTKNSNSCRNTNSHCHRYRSRQWHWRRERH